MIFLTSYDRDSNTAIPVGIACGDPPLQQQGNISRSGGAFMI
jgi:hypothetical protein